MNKYFTLVFLIFFASNIWAKPPKAIITGDQMEIIKNGKSVVFTGNAVVRQGESSLKAEKIIHNKDSQVAEAYGNIRFTGISNDKEPIEATGEKARYFINSQKGEIWEGRPHVLYHTRESTSPVHIYADRMQFDQQVNEITALGSVEVISSSACAYAPQAFFSQKEKKVVLKGDTQSRIIYYHEHKGDYTADVITYYVSTRNALLQGNVHGRVYDIKKQ